ncbi:MAG: sulfite dehydrogenase [Gammaproteobacteria bacterium]|nr:sulfite dehydrogenase [Gammaproteobacteria bacterium]
MDRRVFLRASLGMAGGLSLLCAEAVAGARPKWSQAPGRGMNRYGVPSGFEDIGRVRIGSQRGTDGSGSSSTPLEQLNGVITPSGLHFERHHSGIPNIDPDQHKLMIHGLVRRPLIFTMEALDRYPMVSRIQFLECSGNSGALMAPEAPNRTCGELHGLVSASEWTGVPLAALLEEAGVQASAKWLVAEGADAAMMSRSVPLEKALDDAIVALYQNGERLRPENGYPVRLFLPGWEGNMHIKWLQRIKVLDRPAMTKDETSKYSDLQADGTSLLFTFPMGVKSVITSPSPGLELKTPGLYQVTGLAWSGAGKIARVEVSADGGASWADAALDDPVLPKNLARFRSAWRWDGRPTTLLSRAVDDTGAVQPTRDAVIAERANGSFYHYNAIQAWRVGGTGEVRNVYL